MLYVIHAQFEVEDEAENHCEIVAIRADKKSALDRALTEATTCRERLEDETDDSLIDAEDDDEFDVVETDVAGVPLGYRVIEIGADYWHASFEVLEVEDVDLGSHHD